MAKLTRAEILSQIPAARARGEATRKAGLLASSVAYDRRSGRFLLELTNGTLLGIPVRALSGLAEATPRQLSTVKLEGAGGGLRIEELDADVSVPGLILATVGKEIVAKTFGHVGGSATSKAKAAAARLNGAKGGRPRKNNASPRRAI
jgi:hypothetical protein